MAATRAGDVVGGRYRLDSELGSGGFGCVWRARDLTLDVDVAIKELRLLPGMSPEEQTERLARATREARNAARLRTHENIVAIHDIVHQDDLPWIVMDLVDGCSLAEHLAAHGPLPVDRAAAVAAALLTAIGAAHRQGVVHRDIKPANVMLSRDGKVLLTDFGTAIHATDTSLTATGMVIGSPEYTAPERLRGAEGLPASDVFSLGTTLYQAIEGVSPFRRETATASLTAVLLDQPPPPRRAGPLAHLVTRLLDKDPATRPTVQDALAMTGVSAGPATTPIQAPTGVVRPPTMVFGGQENAGWRPVKATLAALFAAALVLGYGYFYKFSHVWYFGLGLRISIVIDVVLVSALCARIAHRVPPHAGRSAVRAVRVAAVVLGGLVAFYGVQAVALSTPAGRVAIPLIAITVGLIAAFGYVTASRTAGR